MALRRIDHDFFGPIMGQVFGLDEQMSPAMRHMAIDIVEVSVAQDQNINKALALD